MTRLIIAAAGAALVAAVFLGVSARSGSVRAQDGGPLALAVGCNNVTLTWPAGTPLSTVASAVTPAGALSAIWKFDNSRQRFIGFSTLPGAPNDLREAGSLDAVFVCVTAAGSLARPPLGPIGMPTTLPRPNPSNLVNCDVPNASRALDSMEARMLAAINEYRRSLGLPEFQQSPTLTLIARWKAAQLASISPISLVHDDPGRTWEQRFLDCGYPSSASFSENLGQFNVGDTVEQVLTAWKASPNHDPNLRERGFGYIGVAFTTAAGGQTVWVTTFGSDPR
ncbi:MAG: CAP domain-containing protein [Chloroflexi bacterium]|nr:CAP domain-containing protein [Chloroflexota bacterium]